MVSGTLPDFREIPGRNRRPRMARRFVFYALARTLAWLTRYGPRVLAVGFMEGLGRLAFRCRRGDREVALRQLALAFPEWDNATRLRTARASFVCFGRNLVDSVRGEASVRIAAADEERLARIQESGDPVLVLSLHLGSWELLGRWLASRFPAMGVVTANPHNHWVDSWLTRERAAFGLRTFDRRRETLAAARWLRRGAALAVMADHRSQVSSVPAPFFGRPAPTAVGPGRLARRSRARILPVGLCREGGEHWVLVGDEVIWQDAENDSVLTARCNTALEALIRRAPGEWTWFHDRYGETVEFAAGRSES
jgi:KDO2-lipid IV(A) lauroyltransferase